jgi:predicted transglutaminase-like cysteine proteinase
MAYRFAVIVRFALTAIGAVGLILGTIDPLQAYSLSPTVKPIFTTALEKATPPKGWVEFCAHYASECEGEARIPRGIILTPEISQTINDVNQFVNAQIRPIPNMEHRDWHFAEDGQGDCKDYVLVKRQKLIEAGLPRESLLITIVRTPQSHLHAVLIAHTDRGDFVLDNLSPWVAIWSKTNYEFIKRQSQLDPNAWVYIGDDPPREDAVWIAHGLI